MEQDRELLELAALAYGFGSPDGGKVTWTESEYPKDSGKSGALWNYTGWCDTAQLWNPLADDGDALRLAVKLHLDVNIGDGNSCVSAIPHNPRFAESPVEPHGYDADEATRRAIVRAAAEIGQRMKEKE